MSCIKQLPICKASCCKVISVTLPSMDAETKRYYEYKENITVKGNRLIIDCPCRMLDTKTWKCKLHFKNNKPKICQALNEQTKDSHNFYITEGCIYEN